jgi:2-methylfumaryl-CoA isomerase
MAVQMEVQVSERSNDAPSRPLDGLRVVEVSSFVAAPLGGMTLAQLGADVIRIDPIGGGADINRWPVANGSTSLYWVGLNKAKRSLTVDLRSDRGRELVTSMICDAERGSGILLTNSASDWLSYEALSSRRQDLIHVQIDGKRDGSSAVDYTVNAATGFPMVTGPVGWGDPINHVLPAWDMACGLYAATALLSAELRRRRTGAGSQIRVPLEDVALATAGNLGFLAEAQVNHVERPRIGNHLYGSFARDFPTRDGRRVMIVVLTKRHWRDLLSVAGLQDAITALESALDIDLSSEATRYSYRGVIAGLLEPWFAGQGLDEVTAQLSGSSVLWSVYRTFPEVLQDHIANPTGSLLQQIDQPGVGPHLAPGSPISIGPRGTVARVERAPSLGEHSEWILRDDLGLGSDEVREFLDAGIVAGAKPQLKELKGREL